MLTRLYADNFRCLVNFELKLDETNVFVGPNGSGKTSVLDVLGRLQEFIVRRARVGAAFPARDLSLAQARDEQRFELDLQIDGDAYRYGVRIEHDAARRRMRVVEETLQHDDKPIFVFQGGDAQLFHDDYAPGPRIPFDWSQSGVGALYERSDNRKLTRFKKAVAGFVVASPCAPVFEAETRGEDEFLAPLMQNFVGWYRHAAQENMGAIARLFEALGEALPGFDSINLAESGENVRALKVAFRGSDDDHRLDRYGFDQLSDGQRALVALYCLIFLSNRGASLFLDEPDNYLALREGAAVARPARRALWRLAGAGGRRFSSSRHHRLHGGSEGKVVPQGRKRPGAGQRPAGADRRRHLAVGDGRAGLGKRMSGVSVILLCEDARKRVGRAVVRVQPRAPNGVGAPPPNGRRASWPATRRSSVRSACLTGRPPP